MTGETLQIVQVRQFQCILSMTNGQHFVAICRYNTLALQNFRMNIIEYNNIFLSHARLAVNFGM